MLGGTSLRNDAGLCPHEAQMPMRCHTGATRQE